MQINQYANTKGVTRGGGHRGRGPGLVSRRKGHGAAERQDPDYKRGFTLIEILVVIAIFAFLGIIVTRSVLLTIGGSKKSESIVKVRENLDYAMGVIERQVRNANSVVECPNPDPKILNYIDQYGQPGSFSCQNIGGPSGVGSVASGSASLTSQEINLTSCSFSCQRATTTSPPIISVSLQGRDINATGVQGADVTIFTQISLRNY